MLGAILVPFLCLSGGCAAARASERFTFSRTVMGVRADVTAYSRDPAVARAAAKAAFDEMFRIESVLTDYRADSEAMRLCDAPPGVPVPISPTLFDVLWRSTQFSEATGGAFDVTVGPLVGLWREARRTRTLPDPADIARCCESMGWRRVVLYDDGSKRFAVLDGPAVRLDFGGIGKGYAADRAVAVMREHGVPSCLVAVAGDISVGDPPPGRDG